MIFCTLIPPSRLKELKNLETYKAQFSWHYTTLHGQSFLFNVPASCNKHLHSIGNNKAGFITYLFQANLFFSPSQFPLVSFPCDLNGAGSPGKTWKLKASIAQNETSCTNNSPHFRCWFASIAFWFPPQSES